LGNTNQFGCNLQRTMSLLAASTPARRHTVKILFYGQSITEQAWWQIVAEDLRRRYPHANLVIENRAIGGFASNLLVKMLATDLDSFYPDLVIFHVYGSHHEYENILCHIREHTTSEILLQTDHITQDDQLAEEWDPAKLTIQNWHAFMNQAFLPDMARKYHAALCDQRAVWKQYLRDYQLSAARLLRDEVHLNPQGEYLMAECVKPWLVWRPETNNSVAADPLNCDGVQTYRVGQDVKWRSGRMALEVAGNRVDLICAGRRDARTQVRIDGRKPSEFPGLYGLTRTTSYPGTTWPCLLRVTYQQPWQLEEWTLTLRGISADRKTFRFTCAGSRTGPDGEGVSTDRFVSKSGRVVIDPADWNLAYASTVSKEILRDGFKIQWEVVPRFVDEFSPSPAEDPTVESVVTVAQGLSNGRHKLEIQGGPQTNIIAVRVYRPPSSFGSVAARRVQMSFSSKLRQD
jgi:hypothetical protein